MKKLFLLFTIFCACVFAGAQVPQTSDVSHTEHIVSQNSKWVNGIAPGYWATCTNGGTTATCSGLIVYLSAGTALNATAAQVTYAGGTLTMADNSTNYVYLDSAASFAPASNTTGFSCSNPQIAKVTTLSGVVTNIADVRLAPQGCNAASGIKVNGAKIAGTNGNFNDSTPAAGTNFANVKFQKDTSTPDTNISAEVPAALDAALGLIKSATCSSHNWISSITSGTGAIGCSQPAFSDVSGSVACLQQPAQTGDTTTSAGSCTTTTGKVNGVSYPASPSTNAVPIITASNIATYKVIPDCQDTTGNHLNFTQSSDTWNCGTSTPTGGGSCAGSSSSFGIVHTNNNSVVAHVAFASTVTCGNTLFALIHSLSSAVDPPVVADSACTGNWTLIDKNTANTRKLWFYYCVATSTVTAPLGAGDNVTSTTNCDHCGITVWEASGLAALDVHANTYFASSATPSITVTPTVSNSVILAGIAADDFNASVVSPLILGDFENGNDSEVWGYEQSLGGSVIASFTSAGGHTSDLPLVAASFKTANSYPGNLFYQSEQVDGVALTQEPIDDLVSGTGITISGADDSANTRTKRTVSLSTPVTVARGGTGAATLNAHGVVLGNTTSAVNVTSAGTSGQCLTSNGASADPTYQACGSGISGSASYPGMRAFVTVPSNLTWVNQGTSTQDNTGGYLLLVPQIGSFSNRLLVKSIPGFTTNVTLIIAYQLALMGANSWGGILVRESSSGKFIDSVGKYNSEQIAKWSSVSSVSANYISTTGIYGPVSWEKVVIDSTNRTFYTSVDGNTWFQADQHAKTDFCTADQWGIHANADVGGMVKFLSFEEIIN